MAIYLTQEIPKSLPITSLSTSASTSNAASRKLLRRERRKMKKLKTVMTTASKEVAPAIRKTTTRDAIEGLY